MMHRHFKLCLVTNLQTDSFHRYKHFILQAIKGGVTSIQLRDKIHPVSDILRMALELKALLTPLKIPLIINDHVDIAKKVDAKGVHIGSSDLPPMEARKILGPNKIIGFSVETWEDLELANQLTCIDYIAASAVFQSVTKLNCKTIWGLEGLQKIIQKSKHPVVGIGGISQDNIKKMMESGACGAAVISAIHNHPDPRKATADLIHEINQTIQGKEYV